MYRPLVALALLAACANPIEPQRSVSDPDPPDDPEPQVVEWLDLAAFAPYAAEWVCGEDLAAMRDVELVGLDSTVWRFAELGWQYTDTVWASEVELAEIGAWLGGTHTRTLYWRDGVVTVTDLVLMAGLEVTQVDSAGSVLVVGGLDGVALLGGGRRYESADAHCRRLPVVRGLVLNAN